MVFCTVFLASVVSAWSAPLPPAASESNVEARQREELSTTLSRQEVVISELWAANPKLSGISTVFPTYERDAQVVILVTSDGAEIRRYLSDLRYDTRPLTDSELRPLRGLLSRTRLSNPKSSGLLGIGHGRLPTYQFVEFRREGETRRAYPLVGGYRDLFDRFSALASHTMAPRHRLVEGFPGARLIIRGEGRRAVSRVRRWGDEVYVCLTTPDTGVGFVNAYTGGKAYLGADPEWFLLEGDRLRTLGEVPWSEAESGELQPGFAGYARVVKSSDGRIACASRLDPHRDVVLVDTQTSQESQAIAPTDPGSYVVPLLHLEERRSFLLYQALVETPERGSFLFLSEAGVLSPAEGPVSPFLDHVEQPLARAGDGLFWCALSSANQDTEIGTISPRDLAFRPWLRIPGAVLTSSQVCVDQATDGVYVASDGDLLWFPLLLNASQSGGQGVVIGPEDAHGNP